MPDPDTLREIYERNAKAISLRPAIGISTGRTRVQLRDGTTCHIQNGSWSLIADVGTDQGGNDRGPGPGVFERAALGNEAVGLGWQDTGLVPYRLDKALRVAEAVMARRGVSLTDADRALLAAIAEQRG